MNNESVGASYDDEVIVYTDPEHDPEGQRQIPLISDTWYPGTCEVRHKHIKGHAPTVTYVFVTSTRSLLRFFDLDTGAKGAERNILLHETAVRGHFGLFSVVRPSLHSRMRDVFDRS